VTTPFIARWDLDKTYLRTDFDTLRDLVRTAFERPDQKRTVPGAGSLLRELSNAGARIHILSGSPEQMRGRIEQKLRLDGARFDSLTLKPNLQNFLRLRLRALRDQLGFKLPVLLRSRIELERNAEPGAPLHEVLLGDDAEADAFVYSLYADLCAGRVGMRTLAEVMRRGSAYDDSIADALELARAVEHSAPVERIFIHLDRQSPRSRFAAYGGRVVPFYNYLQVALVLAESGRLPAAGVVRVAAELVLEHRFDADRLARSYLDVVRRGFARGTFGPALRSAADAMVRPGPLNTIDEVRAMCDRLETLLPSTLTPTPPFDPLPDYLSLIYDHNLRKKHTLARTGSPHGDAPRGLPFPPRAPRLPPRSRVFLVLRALGRILVAPLPAHATMMMASPSPMKLGRVPALRRAT
jgi:hypothetical protein